MSSKKVDFCEIQLVFRNARYQRFDYNNNVVLKAINLIIIPFLNKLLKNQIAIYMDPDSVHAIFQSIYIIFYNKTNTQIQQFLQNISGYIHTINKKIDKNIYGGVYELKTFFDSNIPRNIVEKLQKGDVPIFDEKNPETSRNIKYIIAYPNISENDRENEKTEDSIIMKNLHLTKNTQQQNSSSLNMLRRNLFSNEDDIQKIIDTEKNKIENYVNSIFQDMLGLEKVAKEKDDKNQNEEDQEMKTEEKMGFKQKKKRKNIKIRNSFKIGNELFRLDNTGVRVLDKNGDKVSSIFSSKTKGLFFQLKGKRVYLPEKIQKLSLKLEKRTNMKLAKEGNKKSKRKIKKKSKKS